METEGGKGPPGKDTMNGTTTREIEFIYHLGQNRRTATMPAGTTININAAEMEANPGFFHVTLPDTGLNHHAYVSRSDVAPA